VLYLVFRFRGSSSKYSHRSSRRWHESHLGRTSLHYLDASKSGRSSSMQGNRVLQLNLPIVMCFGLNLIRIKVAVAEIAYYKNSSYRIIALSVYIEASL
jgi:hypothetical protein